MLNSTLLSRYLREGSGVKIRTQHHGTFNLGGTIVRNECWSAIDANTYDGASTKGTTAAIGWGRTEEEAIADLKEQLEAES